MRILVPNLTNNDYQSILNELHYFKPLKPFEKCTLDFIKEISMTILKTPNFRTHPELIAMAFWIREANLLQIKKIFENKNKILLPRGLVLHFAPSNVDSIFIYSWFISLLLGNSNVIRISRKQSVQTQLLLEVINTILKKEEYKVIKDRTLVMTYDHDDQITKTLSGYCNVRIIWGGDHTINTIRSIPLPPKATEIVFADKFSLTALNIEAVIDADDKLLLDLCTKFYNDSFWFDQLACSSPKVITWIGNKEKLPIAQQKFWNTFKHIIESKGHNWGPEVGITRMATGYSYALQGFATRLSSNTTDLPYRIYVNELNDEIRDMHCGGGTFLEKAYTTIEELIPEISRKDQTLTYFGFSKEELNEFALNLGGYGIDRIVPIGEALTFNTVWDGYDFLSYLTREVTIP